jgi:lysozyme
MMMTSWAGISMIKGFEKFMPISYLNDGGSGKWTIGFGHTGPEVKEGQTITRDAALTLLARDLNWAELAVTRAIKVNLTQMQFDALVSLTFNIGAKEFYDSHVALYTNAKRWKDASLAFLRFVYIKGEISEGLTNRRNVERRMFEGQPALQVS